MTLLSRKADYALLILSALHRPAAEGGAGTARAIAERFGLSRAFTANILKELCQKGFVASQRGVKGGYALARPAGRVSLAELLTALEDGFRLTVCSPAHAHAHGGHVPTGVTAGDAEGCSLSAVCTVKGPLADVQRRLMAVLAGVTLADLFGPAGGPAAPLLDLGRYAAPAAATRPAVAPATA